MTKQQSIKLFIQTGEITTKHPIYIKMTSFLKRAPTKQELNLFINRFGKHPKCYLTGDNINLNLPSEYHLDHVIPRSKGGKNIIENMQVTTKKANIAKGALTLEEFKILCVKVSRQFNIR